jgi:hypothetical protein
MSNPIFKLSESALKELINELFQMGAESVDIVGAKGEIAIDARGDFGFYLETRTEDPNSFPRDIKLHADDWSEKDIDFLTIY